MTSHATGEDSSTNFFERARDINAAFRKYAAQAGENIRSTANTARDKWNNSSTSTKALVVGIPIGVVAPLAIIPTLGAVGFTSAGVAAGSIAASMQTSTTAAGSLFALCQSAGATGAVAASTSAAVGAGSGLTAGGIMALIFRRRRNNSNNNSQPSSTEEEPIVIDEQLNAEEHEAEEENQEQNISSDVSTENIDQLAHIN